MDMQSIVTPDHRGPVVIVAAAQTSKVVRQRTLGVCLVAMKTKGDFIDGISVMPNYNAKDYYSFYEKKEFAAPSFDSIRIVKQPQHGELKQYKMATGFDAYSYEADLGYLGKDRFEVLVSVGNETVRIVYFLTVQSYSTQSEGGYDPERKHCPKVHWKISYTPSAIDDGYSIANGMPIVSNRVEQFSHGLSYRLNTSVAQSIGLSTFNAAMLGQLYLNRSPL